MTNSGAGFDSAMGYKSNPQLAENQAADFLLPQIYPKRSNYGSTNNQKPSNISHHTLVPSSIRLFGQLIYICAHFHFFPKFGA
jgi:hypothetical protein